MVPRLRRLRALILHRTPAREKDRVVEVFSREEGRLKLLAAGIRRFPSRRAGHLEPLMESTLVVSSSSRGDSIRDARVLQVFPRLRENLDRLRRAFDIARLLREGTGQHLSDPRLYDAVLALFVALDSPRIPPTFLLTRSAELHLLRHLGSLPDLSRCARCRRPLKARQFTFQVSDSVFLCTRCVPGSAPPDLTNAVKLMRMLLARPVPPVRVAIPESVAAELTRAVEALLRPLEARMGLQLRVPKTLGR